MNVSEVYFLKKLLNQIIFQVAVQDGIKKERKSIKRGSKYASSLLYALLFQFKLCAGKKEKTKYDSINELVSSSEEHGQGIPKKVKSFFKM